MKKNDTHKSSFRTHLPKFVILLMLIFHLSMSDFGLNFSDNSIDIVEDNISEDEKDSEENELFISLIEEQSIDSKRYEFIDTYSKLNSVKHFCKITSPPPESF